MRKNLSIFIDESGDFGKYNNIAPYYLVTMLFHDQKHSINELLQYLSDSLSMKSYSEHCLHTGPLIRKEEVYELMTIDERKSILNCFMNFASKVEFKYITFVVEKREDFNQFKIISLLSKQIREFIDSKSELLSEYDKIIIYYDNGQTQLTQIMASIFTENNVEFRRNVSPAQYRLFQIADMITTFELINLKRGRGSNSKSEIQFFGSMHAFNKNYYMTKKELFNELYQEYLHLKKGERREKIIAALRPFFKTETTVKNYVDGNIERKRRNLICRRIRLTRKVNLQTFTHFVTFTYNGQLHTEESFKKGLKKTLANFASRKGWKYVDVWERSPEKQSLHFHGLLYIPEGTMPGLLVEKSDYSFKSRRRQITVQNTYFNERFGRSDFEKIEDNTMLGRSVAYLMKYLEKTGEKIVYSKGLPQYFISDVMDDDVVTTVGLEDKKLLLFDDFACWDEGEYMGKVSQEVIKQLRKSN